METIYTSFNTLIERYFEISSLFIDMLLPGSVLPRRYESMTIQLGVPNHLQAQYRLLHLAGGENPAEIHMRYRELAKCHHPDVGGRHTDFLALQQAYEQIVEHLQTHK
jgi:DnaJ-class molecular chaperone